ncbi:MAG: hypothetical protein ACLUSP_00815 [Christensenellales bacterium]
MTGKKSKIIVLAGMIALLVLTGVLNIVINKKAQSVSTDTTASSDFFVTYRADRLATRNQSMLDLDEIIKTGSEAAVRRRSRKTRAYFDHG